MTTANSLLMATIEFSYLHVNFFPPLQTVSETCPHCLQQQHGDKITIQLSNTLVRNHLQKVELNCTGTVLPYMHLMPIPSRHMKIVKQINTLQKYLES